jgi:2-oxoglutarate-Fe(II)-dependent oxygenase superfamily protein
MRIGTLADAFLTAYPFRHVVIDDFLESAFCQRLIAEFPAFDKSHALNEMGEVGRKAAVADISSLGPAYRDFDALMRERSFLALMEKISNVPDLLYDPEYVGGGTHENLNGQDLDLHVDFNYHPRRLTHRRLNLIVFLNPVWRDDWGGCLELHRDPWNEAPEPPRSILPIANRAVLFETTERSWHGFTRITLPDDQSISRRSLAIYFYTKQRPTLETAASHGTVYVPRSMPEHIIAGHILTQADVDNLHILIERRNAQLRFLYERELEFSESVAAITRSPSFRIGRFLTWPLRKLRG